MTVTVAVNGVEKSYGAVKALATSRSTSVQGG